MAFWGKLLLGVVATYAVVGVAAYLGQRKLMYLPTRARIQPAQLGLSGVEERILRTPDGERVIAWYGEARPGQPTLLLRTPDGERVIAWYGEARPGQPTLLYFHGNGGSLSFRASRIERFMREGWGVYMMTYRGYGGSTGHPTEADNVADAGLAYRALVAEVEPGAVILYGESLGSGIAVRLAAEREVTGVILEAPYTSIVDVAAQTYPFLPVRVLLIDRYETTRYIGKVTVPVLILHGERDWVVPVAMGREIARLANEPKRLVTFPDGGHSDLYAAGNDAVAVVRTWISQLGGAREAAQTGAAKPPR